MTALQMEASLKAMEGPLGQPDTMPIEMMAARRMGLCVEALDPIHYDEAAARARQDASHEPPSDRSHETA